VPRAKGIPPKDLRCSHSAFGDRRPRGVGRHTDVAHVPVQEGRQGNARRNVLAGK
jgi:hypothetical protein